jgi:tRNA(Ile)-lysidine synthase
MTPDELLGAVAPPPAKQLLIALSGGPDSAVAAWIAVTSTRAAVRAVHVHHGTTAADELATAAETIAAELGIALEKLSVTVPPGPSWEDQAREVRWAALEASRRPGEVIVTGHHRDDLAETTFIHLMRGAGAAGLAAMAAPRPGRWRPLLEFDRATVAAVCSQLGLGAAFDPGNEDQAHTRNRVRHRVLPQLARELNPQLTASLARTAHALAADDSFIEDQIGPISPLRDTWGAWRIPAPLVATADPAVAARLVRRLLRAARPPHAGTAAETVAAIEVARGTSGRIHIAGEWRLELEGAWLVAHRGDAPAPTATTCELPGRAVFGELDVIAEPAPNVLTRRTSLIDPAVVGREVTLRSARDGERIAIEAGSKLIRDVLAEAGIPRRLRSAWPLAEANGTIAAVVGIRAAPWARGNLGEEGIQEIKVGDTQF